jgi:hypothetical protein
MIFFFLNISIVIIFYVYGKILIAGTEDSLQLSSVPLWVFGLWDKPRGYEYILKLSYSTLAFRKHYGKEKTKENIDINRIKNGYILFL